MTQPIIRTIGKRLPIWIDLSGSGPYADPANAHVPVFLDTNDPRTGSATYGIT